MADQRKSKRVKPQLLKGFRDYTPEEQLAREQMLGQLRASVELMGFLPLQTPALEFAETLLGPHYTPDNLAELFGFRGPDEVDMALRYEFTVSLARYVAANPQLPLPFRRYQYGTVWRVDKPGPGRYREFMQFDIDIVGTRNLLADAEIIAAMVRVFEDLGIERFVVGYSSRKLMNGLVEWAGIDPAKGPDVMRVVDKLSKQGKEAVLLELGPGRTDSSGDVIPGLHLPEEQVSKVSTFLDAAAQEERPLETVAELLGNVAAAREGVQELETIGEYLSAMGVEPSRLRVDPTIVRGLGYYTGPVFETTLLDLPEYGSVFSGGRYDDLVGRFSGEPRPGVGASVGVDRLLAALLHLRRITPRRATSQVLVTVMDADRLGEYLRMLAELREAGIPSEIFSGDTRNITKQVRYADRVGIPLAVIAGSEEFEAGEVTVKNLAAGAEKARQTGDREEWLKAEGFQERIPRAELVAYVKRQLEALEHLQAP